MERSDASSTGAAPARWVRPAFVLVAIVLCIVMPLARLTGPSDLHDQTQEKTSAYTTDLALHASDWRRWVLPMQQGMYPATKPPLYNWLAMPLVRATQGRVQWPHHLPSLLAYFSVAALLWMLGSRLDPRGLTAPLAVIILSTNYAWFKLSVLVRPDTLLSLWLALGWAGVTIILSQHATAVQRTRWRAIVWVSCALAVLTKGPPALLIPLFAALLGSVAPVRQISTSAMERARSHPLASILRRAGSALRECGALWGLPLVLAITAAWLVLVWVIDPHHLYDTLFREEFVDRAMGIGEEGVKHGPWDLLRTSLNMPLYFVMRFLPWSIFFFGALIDLWKRRAADRAAPVAPSPSRAHQPPREATHWMISGVLYAALVIVVFTLSAGKRADYIASAYIATALVTAWCLCHLGWALAARLPALVLAVAVATAGGLIAHDRINGYAAQFPLSDALWDFARQVRPQIEAQPQPLIFYRTGVAPLQVMLNRSQPVLTERSALADAVNRHGDVWLIVTDRGLDDVTAEAAVQGWLMDLRATSQPTKGSAAAAPLEMRLYRVSSAAR